MCRKKDTVKVGFLASSGGHMEQLMKLMPLMKKYDSFLVTEKTAYEISVPENMPAYFLPQINRKEKWFIGKLFANVFQSVKIMVKEKPDVVVTTGVLAMVPLCLLAKLFGKKLVYIESFAKVSTPNQTGKFLYRFADRFYVQWKPMKKVYPRARYVGGIY